MERSRRRGRTATLGAWLVVMALVPLAGAAWFAHGELRAVDVARDHATTVDSAAEELVALTTLQSRLLEEGNTASALEGMHELGIDSATAFDLLGIDLAEKLRSARRDVDAVTDELASAGWAHGIASLRRSGGPSADETADRYEAIADVARHRAQQVLADLMGAAGGSPGSSELVDALRTLEDATVARQAIASQFMGYFATLQSDPHDLPAQALLLVESSKAYDDSIRDLQARSGTSESVLDALTSVHTTTEYRILRQAVSGTIDSVVEAARQGGAGAPVAAVELDQAATRFRAGSLTAERHLDVVVAAGEEVEKAAAQIEQAAAARTRRAGNTIATLALATLGLTLGVATIIGRPLMRLAESARRLSAGDCSVKLRPTGPKEVREATRALNEAVDNLAWAERQATAMAKGRLDDPALDEPAPGKFGASLQEAVTTLATSLAEREEFRRRLSHEASHDSLTQVANRRSVMAQLERGLARTHRSSSQLAVMMIDLDEFKAVNDIEGHPVGDEVLAAVGRRLVTTVRQGDHVGRVGGDEFLVVAEPVSGIEDALHLARRIRDQVSAPIAVNGGSVSVDASIGITVVGADSDLTADELLRDADLAVYKAKAQGGRQLVVCDEDLRAEIEERADIEHALRNALDRDELVVQYQPIVDASGVEVRSLEALVRWERPDVGLVPPDSFIPHAERSDLIVEVDRWVLAAVARQMVEWADHDVLGSVPVAVNVSARHLGRPDFVEGVLGCLQAHGVSPHRLIIEVTESAVLDDMHQAAWALHDLRGHGVQVAIDDFGTGYTSLSHLRALPIDILKIDRSFTNDPAAASLVQLIIDTGHLLGARVTSEGIESDEQASRMRSMGSDELQGFLFGRPVPVEQLAALARTDPAARMVG